MKKTFLLSLLALLLSPPAWAYDFKADDIYYNILSEEDLTCEVTCLYSNSSNEDAYSGDVIIPETVKYSNNTYSVVAIGAYAFSYCSALRSVTILNSVTSIGNYAFYEAPYLNTATIGNSVTSIGNYAFYNCTRLNEITIPNSVTSIGNYAFAYCSRPTEVIVPNSVTSIGSYAFYCCSGVEKFTISESVTSIGSYTFAYCRSLKEITIPNSVTSIGNYAFEDCSSLTDVTIPNSVTSIGYEAFAYCSSLTEVTIPKSVTIIDNYAFRNCTSLEKVTFNATACSSAGRSSTDNYAPTPIFKDCTHLSIVEIGEDVTMIPIDLFYGCSGITTLTIPENVATIGSSAFYGCSGLTEINLPEKIETIDTYTFYGCTSLAEVSIPNSVTSIGSYAFCDCTSLAEVSIPSSVTSIGSYAFYRCSNISIVTSLNPEPPACISNSFSSDTRDDGILYVPAGTTKIYSNADGWKTFKHIVPLDLVIPTITTLEATDITLSIAVLNGSIALGNEDILKVGFEYWIDGGSIYDITASYTDDDMFSATINGLKENTKYYYRAYAETESALYYYGDILSFTTEAKIPPTVTTLEATDITYYSATLNGSVVSGNEDILNVGFEFEDGNIIYDTTASYIGEGLFSVTIDDYWFTSVEENTTYCYRAYAETDSGTYYGEDVSFTTEVNGIDGIVADEAEIVGYYSPDGQRITSPTKGVNIVRLSDGATKKVLVK